MTREVRDLFRHIRADFQVAKAAGSSRPFVHAAFFDLGFRAALSYRVASWLRARGGRLWPRLITRRAVRRFGAELNPLASIGPGLRLGHCVGVVIGAGSRVGARCVIYQGVTLGTRQPGRPNADYPVLGDEVVVYPGASILGGVTIGHNAVIGAGAVVLRDVPAHATAAGVPARILSPGDSLACPICAAAGRD